MRILLGVCVAGFGVVAMAFAVSPGFAAVAQSAPQSAQRFEVVPAEHPKIRNSERRLSNTRPVVILRSEGVSDIVRQGFIRAAICGGIGIFGMFFIGYRIYGRRHGKAAT